MLHRLELRHLRENYSSLDHSTLRLQEDPTGVVLLLLCYLLQEQPYRISHYIVDARYIQPFLSNCGADSHAEVWFRWRGAAGNTARRNACVKISQQTANTCSRKTWGHNFVNLHGIQYQYISSNIIRKIEGSFFRRFGVSSEEPIGLSRSHNLPPRLHQPKHAINAVLKQNFTTVLGLDRHREAARACLDPPRPLFRPT